MYKWNHQFIIQQPLPIWIFCIYPSVYIWEVLTSTAHGSCRYEDINIYNTLCITFFILNIYFGHNQLNGKLVMWYGWLSFYGHKGPLVFIYWISYIFWYPESRKPCLVDYCVSYNAIMMYDNLYVLKRKIRFKSLSY